MNMVYKLHLNLQMMFFCNKFIIRKLNYFFLYPTLINEQETRLAKDELLKWFGGLDHFIKEAHV
jgi:hypothetical protein